MLNGLDLCTGVGGCAEALDPWVRWIAYCENDSAKQSMLVSRMHRGELQTAPIWDDIGTLRGAILPEIDIITAATPCTDISLAGSRTGLAGERSGLIWHVPRLADETQACIVFIENVWPGIRKFVPSIRDSFEQIGFQVRDGVLSAGDCGAWHKRQRWFLLASHPDRIKKRVAETKRRIEDFDAAGTLEAQIDPDSNRVKIRLQSGRSRGTEGKEAIQPRESLGDGAHPNPGSERVPSGRREVGCEPQQPFSVGLLEGNNWDERAAFLLRVDSGLPNRGHRIRAMGDAVPPIQYKTAFQRLMGLDDDLT